MIRQLPFAPRKEQNKPAVLLVDDDDDFLFQQRLQLEHAGFDVMAAQGRREAQEMLARRRPDMAVVDVMMENPDAGFVLCHYIHKKRSLDSGDPGDFGQQRDGLGLRHDQPGRPRVDSRPTPCWPSRSVSNNLHREIDRLLAGNNSVRSIAFAAIAEK